MKTYLYTMAFFLALTTHAQLQLPAQSPSASLKQKIGLTDVEISYSRPSVRERTIFGEGGLLPYGEFWRVGANAATKITFSGDVFLDGEFLKKGSYTLLAKPGTKTWTLNWYVYDSSDWNTYVETKPVLQLQVASNKRDTVLETLELHLVDITLDSGTLLLEWGNVAVQIPLKVNEKEKIKKAIE